MLNLIIAHDVDTKNLITVKTKSGVNTPIKDALAQKSEASSSNISIYDCLHQFRTNESLTGDDMWYCSNCKDHVPAFKKMEVYKTP